MRLGTLLVLGLVACDANSIDGTVDGTEVGGARDAVWDEVEVEIPFAGSYSVTTVIMTDFPDSCAVFEGFSEAEDDADDCEELCEGYLAVVDEFGLDPEDHWSLSFLINTSENGTGDFDFADIPEEDEFSGYFTFVRGEDLLDQSACEDACEDGELLGDEDDFEAIEDGTVTLEEVEDGELPGSFAVEFGGTDLLEGSFRAEACDLEDL